MTTDLPVAQLKSELFKALAHPIRVRALERLVAGEESVGELADQLGVEVTQLSQQLAVLRRASVVSTRRDGNTIYYSVRDPRMAKLLVVARGLVVSNLEDSRSILVSLEEEGIEASGATQTSTS
ncbi:MAG TPA: metalloregulator ArsR/SmtB family transcription factor [Terrimesophilobacter sp.]|nr:metalloregulator ArsR/SmtB family transcription factor [Terrimesophilobacter sp.]